ncbi:hypothetical protein [Streptomyces sp. NPDC008121]|uniref:hypothetical protein n=1 Tax=Streptomyces sp. NPDC008121 TaxID=3364809 RepID=UPI0036E45A9A
MTLAQHLAALDLLRARALPQEGYHLAELEFGGPADGPSVEESWEERVEQAVAERDALAVLLAGRWGPPRIVTLSPLLDRYAEGEAIAAPWDLLCTSVPEARVWQVEDRWLVLGLTPGSAAGTGLRLLTCLTETPPP